MFIDTFEGEEIEPKFEKKMVGYLKELGIK